MNNNPHHEPGWEKTNLFFSATGTKSQAEHRSAAFDFGALTGTELNSKVTAAWEAPCWVQTAASTEGVCVCVYVRESMQGEEEEEVNWESAPGIRRSVCLPLNERISTHSQRFTYDLLRKRQRRDSHSFPLLSHTQPNWRRRFNFTLALVWHPREWSFQAVNRMKIILPTFSGKTLHTIMQS